VCKGSVQPNGDSVVACTGLERSLTTQYVTATLKYTETETCENIDKI